MKAFTPCAVLFVAALAASSFAEVPDAARLLPDSAADALLVGSLDVRQLADLGELDMADKLIPLLMKQLEEPELFDELQFDITKDLHSIACVFDIDLERGDDPKFIFVATGAFKVKAILEAITKRAKVELVKVNGVDVLPFDDDANFAILGDTAAVLGTRQWVHDAIERFADANRGESKAAERLKNHTGAFSLAVNPARLPEDLWEITQMIGIGQQNVVSAGIAAKLKQVTRLNMDFQVKALFDTPDTAEDVLQKAKNAMNELAEEHPIAQACFDMLNIAQEGNALTTRTELPMSQFMGAPFLVGMVMPMYMYTAKREEQAFVRENMVLMEADPLVEVEGIVQGDPQEQAACENNLQRIAIALHVHVNEQEDKAFPANLKEMVDNEVLLDMSLLVCPADRTAFTPGEWYTSYETLFELTEKRIPQDSIPADTIIIWDKQMRHGGGRNVLLADGSVKFVPEHRFQALLQRAKRAVGE